MANDKNSDDTTQTRDGFMKQSKALSSILPSPAILESYEEIHPGMVAKLIKIVEKEQSHRHLLERIKLRYNILASHLAKTIKVSFLGLLSIFTLYSVLSLQNIGSFSGILISILMIGFLTWIFSCSGRKKIIKTNESSDAAQNTQGVTTETPKKYKRFRPRNRKKIPS